MKKIMALSYKSRLLQLVFGAALGAFSACHSPRAVSQEVAVQTRPRALPDRQRVVSLTGKVYTKQDSTAVIPGLELVFRPQHPDSTNRAWRDITKPDGSYRVTVAAGPAYLVELSKDGKTTGTRNVMIGETPSDTTHARRDFYVHYVDSCCTDGPWFTRYYFDTNSSALRPASLATVDNFIQYYPPKDRRGLGILVEGNAEPKEAPRNQPGRQRYLHGLALARAKNMCKLLQKKGFASNRLYIRSYGDQRPAAPNTSPEYRQLNRRVELQFLLPSDTALLQHATSYAALVQQAGKGTVRQKKSPSRGRVK